jgi:hypothetical protein
MPVVLTDTPRALLCAPPPLQAFAASVPAAGKTRPFTYVCCYPCSHHCCVLTCGRCCCCCCHCRCAVFAAGCWKDEFPPLGRAIPTLLLASPSMTVEACTQLAWSRGYAIAALQYTNECYASRSSVIQCCNPGFLVTLNRRQRCMAKRLMVDMCVLQCKLYHAFQHVADPTIQRCWSSRRAIRG